MLKNLPAEITREVSCPGTAPYRLKSRGPVHLDITPFHHFAPKDGGFWVEQAFHRDLYGEHSGRWAALFRCYPRKPFFRKLSLLTFSHRAQHCYVDSSIPSMGRIRTVVTVYTEKPIAFCMNHPLSTSVASPRPGLVEFPLPGSPLTSRSTLQKSAFKQTSPCVL